MDVVAARKIRFEAVIRWGVTPETHIRFDIDAYDLRDAWTQLKVAVFTHSGMSILPGWFAEKDASIYIREGRRFRRVGSLREADEAPSFPEKNQPLFLGGCDG